MNLGLGYSTQAAGQCPVYFSDNLIEIGRLDFYREGIIMKDTGFFIKFNRDYWSQHPIGLIQPTTYNPHVVRFSFLPPVLNACILLQGPQMPCSDFACTRQ